MAWVIRGKYRYFYRSIWDRKRKRRVTYYVRIDEAAAVAQTAEQKVKRQALKREARAAYRAVLAKQREKRGSAE